MKTLVVRLAAAILFLLTGCGTFSSSGSSRSKQSLIQFTRTDLQATVQYSAGHQDVPMVKASGDCAATILRYLPEDKPADAAIEGGGLFLAAAKARVAIEPFKSGQVPDDIMIACAPLIVEKQLFWLRLTTLLGGH